MSALSAGLDPTHMPSACLATSPEFELSFSREGARVSVLSLKERREEEGEREGEIENNGMGSLTSPVYP